MNHPSSLRYAVTGEIHPDTVYPVEFFYSTGVVPPYRAGERGEINKITFDRKFLNSRSQSPDWECIVIETLFCVPKVGFGNEVKVVGFGNEIKGVGFGNEVNGVGFNKLKIALAFVTMDRLRIH